MKPIHLALVWHMHQPYYKDDLTNTYLLPWVRLHAVKDYHKMAALLDGYPRVRQTFNLVPSLLSQVDEYSRGEATDLFLNLCRRPAEELSQEERNFLIRWLREEPTKLRVQQSPRYLELAGRPADADAFDLEDVRDLQVWANLAWCDPAWVEGDRRLSALKIKDRDYTEADKTVLFDAQLEMIRAVIPKYRALAEAGQIELTTSPYYHPILPLIAHVDAARTASPGIELPHRHFSHREDAEQQVQLGLATFERLLGRRPHGLWPSEMAVGESVIGMAIQAGLEWMISDEDVLGRSLEGGLPRDGEGRIYDPEALYGAYRIEREGREIAMVFRDKVLSNLVGFDYYRMSAQDAVSDFMGRLRRIQEQQGDRDFLVTVALDGENAWEFYPRDGHDFLNALYTELDASTDVVCTTVGEYLHKVQARRPLHRLFTGSWINGSLDTWIGDPEHTVAWDLLAETRDWLDEQARTHPGKNAEATAAAWREILITEGSDWYWWFSRRHDSGMDVMWDNQFRLHLRNVYKLLEAKPPSRLFEPIVVREGQVNLQRPAAEFSPQGPDDPAWSKAGRFEVSSGFGALHRPSGLVSRLFYGFDQESLHLKIESSRTPAELAESGVSYWLYLSGPPLSSAERKRPASPLPLPRVASADLGFEPGYAAEVRFDPEGAWVTVHRLGGWERRGDPIFEARVAASGALVVSIPFDAIQKDAGEPLELALAVARGETELERVPPTGSLGVRVPGPLEVGGDPSRQPLKVLFATAELSPYAKTGGLADVSASLPKELRRLGQDVRIVMPRYRQINPELYGLRVVLPSLEVPLGSQSITCSILEGRLGEVPVYFVDCPQLYDRDGGPYGYGDDDARFIYFNRALLEMLRPLEFIPDVIHVHDWHTALVPNLLEMVYLRDPGMARVATVLTIHNLAFQGVFGYGSLALAGLEHWGLLKVGVPHLDDIVNLLGRGIHFADIVNTVSERYAEEIQTPEYGEGMDALLARQSHKLHGIVNGIDTELFNPETDPAVPHHYSAADPTAKRLNRAALRSVLGLRESEAPILAMISRLYDQKGLDLVQQALPAIVDQGLQFVVLGTGERRYEDLFRYAAEQHPEQVSASIGFDHHLAQLIYAGADMVLMASRFEPCGLGQLIGMRYGTIPVVRATGGLVDTVRDYNPATGEGTGFMFGEYDPWRLFAAVVRAAETYRHAETWDRLVRRDMTQDVSWAQSARRYIELYRTAVVSNRDRRGVPPAGLVATSPA